MHSSKLDILCRIVPACYNSCTQNHELSVVNFCQHSAKLSSSEQQAADSLLTHVRCNSDQRLMLGGGTMVSWAALHDAKGPAAVRCTVRQLAA